VSNCLGVIPSEYIQLVLAQILQYRTAQKSVQWQPSPSVWTNLMHQSLFFVQIHFLARLKIRDNDEGIKMEYKVINGSKII
jgi:hypothetical protein